MPAFTHFRPAQPVLVAHFFLSHATPLMRDHARFTQARDEADALPLGSGAVAGTPLRHRRRGAAPAISASRASWPTAWTRRRIAISRRRFSMRCTLTMVHLSRLAEDLIILTGDEHRFFELSDALCTGSSIDAAEEESGSARARARQNRPHARTPRRVADDDRRDCRPVTTRICRRTRKRCLVRKTR